MSIETRSNSALFKRAEQLKRWEDSDTNRESVTPDPKSRKVKFSSACEFLAACAAGDKAEVLKLLEKGADINTANVDGLTALHQACIDDNLDMVEFLVEHGADVNRGDNEGWTPLHATASCDFLYIAKYLLEKNADVAAVNNDGELAIDIDISQKMEDLLKEEIRKRGIDCDAARNEERKRMMEDALEWLANKSSLVDTPHPKNGATALHVAAAKGYTDVIKVLLQCGSDVDCQDVDGWTPLHAAAHWGQKDACGMLVENLADMDAKNFVGQTPFDLADTEMFRFLEDLRKKQNKEDVVNRRQAKKRVDTQNRSIEIETPTKVKKVEVEITNKEETNENNVEMDVSSSSESETETESSSETESNSSDDGKENKPNLVTISDQSNENVTNKTIESVKPPPSVPPKQVVETNSEENPPSWRKPYSRQSKPDLPSPVKSSGSFRDRSNSTDINNDNEVTLRRTSSFQSDKEFYSKYEALHARIKAYKDSTIIPYSSRLKSHHIILTPLKNDLQDYRDTKENQSEAANSVTVPTPTSPTKTSPTTSPNNLPLRRSFVPPTRDEESETQRKAHAKRVRETRRSTQGVTLEEIKSAEQFVKKKNQTTNNDEPTTEANGDTSNGITVTATITTGSPTVITRDNEEITAAHERRPSWRLRIDSSSSKFKLEDANKPSETPSTPSFVRRTNSQQNNTNTRPLSAPVETADTSVTIPLRRPKSQDDKDQDKENDVRNAQATLATQAAIQRRRRPKRRSTGVVSFDNVEDAESEKDPSTDGEHIETRTNNEESDRSSRSRLGSTSDIRNENGEIDYKKLYEQAIAENERLRDKLRKSDEDLRDTKQTLEKINVVTSKNSLSELEKRERRTLERKLSEMEEELKQLQKLKAENERLKADNRSLTRVISKLTNSPKK